MVERARLRQLLAFAALVVLLLIVMIMIFGGPANWAQFFVDRQVRPGLFIFLMLLLPLAGFPISAFLLAVGIKFGPYEGFAITSVIIGVHLVVTFFLTHSLLRPYIVKIMAQTRYELPRIHAHRQLVFAVIFMVIPALPYTVKNFSLALLNVPWRIYLPVAWGANLLLAIPFIGLGHSAIANPRLAWLFLALLGIGYLLASKLWQKYGKDPAGRQD
jgi:uncharacterized membrane protein YdjX (TVP38/TMEM64 family)